MEVHKNHLFWELRRADLKQLSYLFGTVHISHPDVDSKLLKPFHYLNKVENLFLEVNPLELEAKELKKILRLDNDFELRSLYPERKYQRIKKNLFKYCNINLDHFQNITPFSLINLIHERLIHPTSYQSMDMKIFFKAKSMGIPVKGLIPIQEEIRSIIKMDNSSHLEELYALSRNLSAARKNIDKLLFLYKKEEIHQLYRISKKPLGILRQSLLYQRNFKMAEQLVASLNSGEPFIAAVGAAHLSGKFGLICLLRKQGFILKAL